MAEAHQYRVEGTRGGRMAPADWELILETADPVEAMECAHYVEGWFWRRLLEDGHVVIDQM